MEKEVIAYQFNKRTKKKNTDETLVPVNTTMIDNIWSATQPTKKRGGKTKDTARNLNDVSSEFLTELNKVYNTAMKKDNAKLLSMVTEKTIENFGNILSLLQDNVIRNQWTTASDLQSTNVDGNVKKSA